MPILTVSAASTPKNIVSTALDWVASATSTTHVVASLSFFDVLQRIVFFTRGQKAQQRVVRRMAKWVNRGLFWAGAHCDIRGLENVDPNQNYIIVMNHQSMFDISMVVEHLKNQSPRFISKIQLARGVPGISTNLRLGQSALIDRKNPQQSYEAIAELARRVRDDNWSVVIFPEGTRSRDGVMKPFKSGGLKALIDACPGVPVLPISSSGGSLLFSNNLRPVVRNVELKFIVHRPVYPPKLESEEAGEAFTAELRNTIATALEMSV